MAAERDAFSQRFSDMVIQSRGSIFINWVENLWSGLLPFSGERAADTRSNTLGRVVSPDARIRIRKL